MPGLSIPRVEPETRPRSMRAVKTLHADGNRDVRRLDVWLAVLVVVLVVSTAVVVVAPRFRDISGAIALDVAINVASVLVGAALAILAWIRWRVTGQPVALYESSAFVALTVVNAIFVGLVLGGRDAEFGLSDANPGEAPVYLWILARTTTALLLVVGAARSLRRRRPSLPPLA